MENKSSILGIIAIIIGASGLGVGAYSIVNFQVVEGPQGEDAPGGIVVGIMDPDEGGIISGIVTIRAMIAGSEDYTISILRNGTEIGTSLPMTWNTGTVADGWWNITIIVTDITTNNQNKDEVVVYVQNVEDPTKIYYCSSQTDITNAIMAIGTGVGTIWITEDITLSGSINIDGGGSYTIKGLAPSIVLDCNGDRSAFIINSSKTCIISDLTINALDITSDTMNVINVRQSFTHIDNVQILGDWDRNGYGIAINYVEFEIPSYVWVTNCHIFAVQVGIHCEGDYCHISDNSIRYCDDGTTYSYGIEGFGRYNTIDNNIIGNCMTGIRVGSIESVFSNNVLINNGIRGFYVNDDRNIITGNSISGIIGFSSSSDRAGISVSSGTDIFYNSITSNNIESFYNLGSGAGRGIYIGPWAQYTTVVGNTVSTCDEAFVDSGGYTYNSSNNF